MSLRRSTRSSSTASNSQLSQEDSASREECAPRQKKARKPPVVCKPTQWVTILPEHIMSPVSDTTPENCPSFLTFKDPKTGALSQYLATRENRQICEVQKCMEEPRSWFIGDSVQTDGSLLVCTPVDPLFFALPYLTAAGKAGKFTTLEAILDDSVHSCCSSSELESYVLPEQWTHVCDTKVLSGGMIVYRHSQSKTVQWLRKKVEVLAGELRAQGVQVGSGSHSSSLVKSRRHNSASEDDYLSYACGVVSEYLSEDMAASLCQSYNFKKSSESSEQPPAKKRRTESVDSGFLSQQSSLEDSQPLTCTPTAAATGSSSSAATPTAAATAVTGSSSSEPLEDYTKYNTSSPAELSTKPQKQTSAQKALSKVDKKGMKSLSSFFGTKTKT